MSLKMTIFVLAGVIAHLSLVNMEEGEPRGSAVAAKQEIPHTESHHSMTLISYGLWVLEGKVMGTVAAYAYNNVATRRPVDYWEVYDNQGNLIVVSWFDGIGMSRTAMDRGIVEEKDQPEGVLVEVVQGERV